jgi:hypothetical protein
MNEGHKFISLGYLVLPSLNKAFTYLLTYLLNVCRRQQVKNCCPPRPATYINKQNGGTTRIIRNYDFPSLCSNKECKREEKYTIGNRNTAETV